ncbi:MAG: cytochrome c family protein [Paracoccaceae bacterium]
MSSPLRGALAAALTVTLALPAFADGDAAKGQVVFKKCLACHSVEPGAPSKVGPNLHDVVGRKSGTFEGFKYSPAMLKMGEEGHVWTPEEIDKLIEAPMKNFPGIKMAFPGLKKPEERADVIAYLISLHPDGAAAGGAAPAAAPAADTEAPAPSN